VFAQAPVPGQVMTRLVPPLGPAGAAHLARAFLLDVLASCRSLERVRFVLAYAPRGTRPMFAELAGPAWRLMCQRGGDLGQRLQHACDRWLQVPGDRVAIIGTDSPVLPPEFIEQAFRRLAEADVVLGPTPAGAHYLVAQRYPSRRIFRNVRWRSEHALRDLCARARRAHATVALLPSGRDVDNAVDLARLQRQVHSMGPALLPHTRAALDRLSAELFVSSGDAADLEHHAGA